MNEAEIRGLLDTVSLDDLVARYPRRRGVRIIKAILGMHRDFTRSELETRFLTFVRSAQLPPPLVNTNVLGYECDFVWRDQGMIVELDGHRFHRTRAAFERDRARDRTLQVAGWRVVRVTWRQLHQSAGKLATDLAKMLAARGRPPGRARGAGP